VRGSWHSFQVARIQPVSDLSGLEYENRHHACLIPPEPEEVSMFALSAILIGVIGVVYVRRRSARKKQGTV